MMGVGGWVGGRLDKLELVAVVGSCPRAGERTRWAVLSSIFRPSSTVWQQQRS